MDKPYRVELSRDGCPTCHHDAQYDIVGPGEVAQSQTWGDEKEANYICELLNDAYQAGRSSYAEKVLGMLPPPEPPATDEDIPF